MSDEEEAKTTTPEDDALVRAMAAMERAILLSATALRQHELVKSKPLEYTNADMFAVASENRRLEAAMLAAVTNYRDALAKYSAS
jgi:hypothetical protein